MANGGRRIVKEGLKSRGLAREGCFAAGRPIGGAELNRRDCGREAALQGSRSEWTSHRSLYGSCLSFFTVRDPLSALTAA